jgi:hypothetical protein
MQMCQTSGRQKYDKKICAVNIPRTSQISEYVETMFSTLPDKFRRNLRHTVKVPAHNPAKLNLAETKLPQADQVKEHFKGCNLINSGLGTGADNAF